MTTRCLKRYGPLQELYQTYNYVRLHYNRHKYDMLLRLLVSQNVRPSLPFLKPTTQPSSQVLGRTSVGVLYHREVKCNVVRR